MVPSSGEAPSEGGCLAREGAPSSCRHGHGDARGPGRGPARAKQVLPATPSPRPSRWSPALRPRTSARTSPPGCSSSPPRDSASLSKLQIRWVGGVSLIAYLPALGLSHGKFAGALGAHGAAGLGTERRRDGERKRHSCARHPIVPVSFLRPCNGPLTCSSCT